MKTLFLGDISPTAITSPLYEKEDYETLFSDTLELFKEKDIIFANLECAITEHDEPIKKFGPPLKSPFKTAKVLKELGINYVSLSNNHVFDYGIKGIKDTIDALSNYGIKYTGFGSSYEDSRKNLIIEKNGEKIAFISVCEHEYSYALSDRMGSRPFDIYDTLEDIKDAKSECDRVIVTYHGGKEECRYPSPRLLKVCRAMAKAGADVILCQHSHCIGCYEEYEGSHILYGQGNFNFVKPELLPTEKLPFWESAFSVIYDTKTHKIEFIPTVTLKNGITLAKGEKKETILKEFKKRNEEIINGKWKDGWHDFCESKRKIYTDVITGGNLDNFAHYLDCEAHTDVWRELFPTWNQTNERN